MGVGDRIVREWREAPSTSILDSRPAQIVARDFPPSHRRRILPLGRGRRLGVVGGALCGTPLLWFLRRLLPCAYPQLPTQPIHLITRQFVNFRQSIASV